MRNYFLILLAVCNGTIALSQDIIVLRKNEQEVKCRIIIMNDSLVTYRLWKSEDTTSYSVKKFEVMSFMIDKRSQKSKSIDGINEKENDSADLLGEYMCGTIAPGYVLTGDTDTLRGFISIKNMALSQVEIIFSDSAGKKTVYSLKDAKGYGYAKIRYEKVKSGYKKEFTNGHKTKDGYQFLHLAVDGPSKLYRFYSLHFKNSTMISYDQNPPMYLGKLHRQFLITNPEGKKIFTKGRTLQGALNRIYHTYPNYLSQFPPKFTKASELSKIITGFNYWFENNK